MVLWSFMQVCYPKGCATPSFVPCQGNTWRPLEQAQEDTSPRKINVTSKLPVGSISDVTLIRTDTTLDHSQKAEKVCFYMSVICADNGSRIWKLSSVGLFLSLDSWHPVCSLHKWKRSFDGLSSFKQICFHLADVFCLQVTQALWEHFNKPSC